MAQGHLYPDEAFRAWEGQRMNYDAAFAGLVSELVKAEVGTKPLLLDAAAGEGYGAYLLELASSDATVVSVDLDESSLSNDRWLPNDEEAMRVVGSVDGLSFKNGAFDGIVSVSGLHTIDPVIFPDIISETHRILRPGGKLLLTNDTPRGLSYIFEDPLLMYDVRPEQDEITVVTYDNNGDICQPVVVKTRALDETMGLLCARLNTGSLTANQYNELMASQDGKGELSFIDLYARAAQLALQQKSGYRPFEYNSNGGSWNKYFFSTIMQDIKDAGVGFSVSTVRRDTSTSTTPLSVIMPDGTELFVKSLRRDSVGNLYVSEYSTSPVDATEVDIKAQFIVAEKV